MPGTLIIDETRIKFSFKRFRLAIEYRAYVKKKKEIESLDRPKVRGGIERIDKSQMRV